MNFHLLHRYDLKKRIALLMEKADFMCKTVAKRHHMVSGTLAPLYTVFGLKLGCNGAAAPIGDKVL